MLRLLVALDFSECSRVALGAALAIAERAAPADIVILSVLDRDDQSHDALAEVETTVQALHDLVEREIQSRSAGESVRARLHYAAVRGIAADEIVRGARDHKVDAIVIGTHGRTGLNRILVGSVAEKVVRTAPCSVLTVKPKRTD